MAKYIAVQGCQVSAASGGVPLTAVIAPSVTPSTKVKCDKKAAYVGSITVQVSGTVGTVTVTAQSVTIDGSSKKSKSENKSFLLEGDSSKAGATVQGVDSATSSTVSIPVTTKVESAGQIKVKVE